ncbi:MAG: hypothetical protein ACOH2O_12625 [Pseudomonas sp.]
MHIINPIVFSAMLAAVTVSAAAQAGPAVSVTFKNNGTAAAIYSAVGKNGAGTKANASPTPEGQVEAGKLNTFTVQSNRSPDVNYAVLHYQMGSKVCQFTTTYLKSRVRGVELPKWNKNAVASGGARCDVKITAVNFSTHAWAVEFTMK